MKLQSIEDERRLELKRRAPLVQCCHGGSWRVESSSVEVRAKNEVAVVEARMGAL